MKTRFVIVGLALALNGSGFVQAGTYFTSPVIYVSHQSLDFGTARSKSSVTNRILVENVGVGRLIGKATVAPPFKILSGETYALDRHGAQIVVISYTPKDAATNMETLTFTGGGGASVNVIGRLTTKPPRPGAKPK